MYLYFVVQGHIIKISRNLNLIEPRCLQHIFYIYLKCFFAILVLLAQTYCISKISHHLLGKKDVFLHVSGVLKSSNAHLFCVPQKVKQF